MGLDPTATTNVMSFLDQEITLIQLKNMRFKWCKQKEMQVYSFRKYSCDDGMYKLYVISPVNISIIRNIIPPFGC